LEDILPAVALNAVEVLFAGTITEEAGTGSRLLLLARFTSVPPFGAAPLNATVHVVIDPALRFVGLHVSDDSVRGCGATRLIVAVRDAPFRLAVKVAL
jgi:hypothetical protein